MDQKPPFTLEDIRAEALRQMSSKTASLKRDYSRAPDCAIEAAELIADQSILLLRMCDLLLPVAGSLKVGDLSPDGSYLLAGAIVLWHEFSKDARAVAGDCVKLIPNPVPSGERTIKGHTEQSVTLSVLHFCGCLFSLAEIIDKKAKMFAQPYIPGMSDMPDKWPELLLAAGYSPQAAAEFIEKELPPASVIREFESKRTGIELELAQISRAVETGQEKPPEILKLELGFYGISLNLKALWRRLFAKKKR